MSRADVTTGPGLDVDDVRRALAAPDHKITAEQLDVLRAAAEQWLVPEEALQCAVAELRAFAAAHGVPIASIARSSGNEDEQVTQRPY